MAPMAMTWSVAGCVDSLKLPAHGKAGARQPALRPEAAASSGSFKLQTATQSTSTPHCRCKTSRTQQPVQCYADNAAAGSAPSSSGAGTALLQQEGPLVPVRFSTTFHTAFGEKLKVVGSHEALGGWRPEAAPDMHWTDGHVWTTDVLLPKGAEFDFKVVHLHFNGVSWETCGNRHCVVADRVANGHLAAVDVVTAWDDPAATHVAFRTADELRAREAAEKGSAEDDAAAAEWDLSASGLPADMTASLEHALDSPAGEQAEAGAEAPAESRPWQGIDTSAALQFASSFLNLATARKPAHDGASSNGATPGSPLALILEQSSLLVKHTPETHLPGSSGAEAVYVAAAEEAARILEKQAAQAATAEEEQAQWDDAVAEALAETVLAEAGYAGEGEAEQQEDAGTTMVTVHAQDEEEVATTEVSEAAGASKGKLNAVGRAAGFAVMGVAAGVAMSVLAVDLTDVAIAGAVAMAGTTLFPGADKKETEKLRKGSLRALGASLEAAEAVARSFGLTSYAERRRSTKDGSREEESVLAQAAYDASETIDMADARLTATIAAAETEEGAGNATDDRTEA